MSLFQILGYLPHQLVRHEIWSQSEVRARFILTKGYDGWGRAHVERPPLWARRLLKIRRHMLQGYIVFLPNGFQSVNNFGELRAGSRLQIPTQSNDLSELPFPQVMVRDTRSFVLL